MFRVALQDSLEIDQHKSYLLENKAYFMDEFALWAKQHDLLAKDGGSLWDEGVYEAFVGADYEEAFHSVLYHQALSWHRMGFNLSRAMLLLAQCRQLFVALSEKKQNHNLAKALCHSVDLGQSIISNVYQLHEMLLNLKQKSRVEVIRMRRSFDLISAQVPEDLAQAFIDHQNWKVVAFSCALGDLPEGDFVHSVHDCQLGKWLDAGGLEKIPLEDRPAFLDAHDQVHLLGAMALQEAQARRPERIVEFLTQMELASDKVCQVLLERIEEEFVRVANLDALTGLPNRAAFDAQLAHNLAFARRHKFWVALIVIDIDLFKKINDKHGHAVGDQLLIEFAQLLESEVRMEDHAYRWGGEEFAILSVDDSPEGAHALAERIRSAVEKNVFCQAEELNIQVTVSIGATSFHPELELMEREVFTRVDERLYEAKNRGRNQVSFSTLE